LHARPGRQLQVQDYSHLELKYRRRIKCWFNTVEFNVVGLEISSIVELKSAVLLS